MSKYDKLFEAGNKAQLERLKESEDGWTDIEMWETSFRIGQLQKSLSQNISGAGPPNYYTIRNRAADIANFAHMIILKCDKQLKEQDNG